MTFTPAATGEATTAATTGEGDDGEGEEEETVANANRCFSSNTNKGVLIFETMTLYNSSIFASTWRESLMSIYNKPPMTIPN